MKKTSYLWTFALLLIFAALVFAQPKPSVAVMPFGEEFDQAWWVQGKMGDKASSLLGEAIFNTGKFSLKERREMEMILKEHNLTASGAVTPETAIKLGKILGVDFMVLGAITEFGWDKYGGSIPYSSRILGGSSGELYNYNSTLSVRIVNVESGEIVYMGSGSGSHRTFGVGFRGYEASAESSYDSVANETLKPAVEKIAADIAAKAASMNTYQGFGRVADVDGGEVLINRGSDHGVKVGQKFTVSRLGKEIKDPDTGQVLKRKEKDVAVVEVISVDGPGMSTCRIVSGDVEPGDMIK